MTKSVLSVMIGLLALSALGGGTAYSQAASQLAISNVNLGTDPQAGIGFSVTVLSLDGSSLPSNVTSPTTVTLTRKTGTGTLGGTLTGIIAAGQDSVVISGVTYTVAESNVSLTATATAGDALSPVDTTPFTVRRGPAEQAPVQRATYQHDGRSIDYSRRDRADRRCSGEYGDD
jgi:hypothetical protein